MNVGGYIDARLRFDWSSLTATDSRPAANNTSAKGATDLLSEAVDITDDTTGVRLVADEDVLPEGTALTVDAITSGSSFDTAAKALDGIAEQFKLYNIQVKADGEDVEPSITVKLYLPIPSDYDSSKVAVYRINSDGTKVVVKGTVEDGKYVIETKTFGLYAVALTDTVQQVVVNTTYDEAVAKVAEKYPDINNHWAASSIAFVVNRTSHTREQRAIPTNHAETSSESALGAMRNATRENYYPSYVEPMKTLSSVCHVYCSWNHLQYAV